MNFRAKLIGSIAALWHDNGAVSDCFSGRRGDVDRIVGGRRYGRRRGRSRKTRIRRYICPRRRRAHEDVAEELKDVENTVVTITQAGTYRVSGSMTDAQIAVAAGEQDGVEIILDGADITCRTAPAILVYSAYEPAEAGEAGVKITLADGSGKRADRFAYPRH